MKTVRLKNYLLLSNYRLLLIFYFFYPTGPIAGLNPIHCKRFFCRLGCVCDSIDNGKHPIEHCEHPACMLESECTRVQEPTPRVSISPFMKRKKSPLFASSPQSSPHEPHPELFRTCEVDPKLRQKCFVRLSRLPAYLTIQPIDKKLKPGSCAVRLVRLTDKQIKEITAPKTVRKRGKAKK